jgi:hypothetical protein
VTTRWLLSSVVPLFLAACSSPVVSPDGGGDVTPVSDATDTLPPPDGSNPLAPLSYMPAGCSYTVTTTMGTANNRMGDATAFGPNPTPTHVHVTWANDPSTSIAVLWATDAATLATVVQYGTSMTSLTQSAMGHVTSVLGSVSTLHEHEVHICGLTPDTTYYYQVGGTGNFSPVQSFRTAPAPGGTGDVNFAVSGDSRDSTMILHQVQQQMLSIGGMQQPDFEVFTGDAVLFGTTQSLWDAWFDAAAPTLGVMPFVFAQGNHEALALNYFVQIAQPQTGMPNQDELYFSFNYGPLHIVVLNDTPAMGDIAGVVAGSELAWLQSDLAAVDRTRTPWVIATHHKAPFSGGPHANDPDVTAVRMAWAPAFAAGGVDVVLNGHDHEFTITHSLLGDGTVAPAGQRGTVYMTAGGAGAMLYSTSMQPVAQYTESTYNFALVHATRTTLQLSPYRNDGTAITTGQVMLTRP